VRFILIGQESALGSDIFRAWAAFGDAATLLTTELGKENPAKRKERQAGCRSLQAVNFPGNQNSKPGWRNPSQSLAVSTSNIRF
jgi:hypothetical protein